MSDGRRRSGSPPQGSLHKQRDSAIAGFNQTPEKHFEPQIEYHSSTAAAQGILLDPTGRIEEDINGQKVVLCGKIRRQAEVLVNWHVRTQKNNRSYRPSTNHSILKKIN